MDPALFLADLEAKPLWLNRIADTLDGEVTTSSTRAMRRSGSATAVPELWPIAPQVGDVEPIGRVLLVGMGSSLYAAQVGAQRLRSAGITAIAESGSSTSTVPTKSDDLIIGVSAGGSSPETQHLFGLCGAGRRIALTNTLDSPMSEIAGATVDLGAGPELGGVACRSYTHTLIALLALERELTGKPHDLAGRIRRSAAATSDLLDRRGEWLEEVTDLLAGPDGTWLLAPLERFSSAQQGALMLREGPRRPAVGCETGDWSHVDVYLTKTLDYRALVFPGSMWDAQAADWLQQRNSTVVAVGGDWPGAKYTLRYDGDDDPVVALLVETLVPELVAASLWAAQAVD
jgi:glutamine---fructose-6-phosphate transaminase (isomerizing)